MVKADKKVIIGIAVLIKLAVSIPFILSFPIDLDEPFSIFHAQKSLPDLMELFGSENNPPLHFIIMHLWEQLFGIDPFAVRSLSLIFSVLTIPVLYSLGKKYLSTQGTILLLILFIFSDFHHYLGMEARTYSLFVFLFAITLNLISEIVLNSKYALKNFAILAILNTLLFYTHYISITLFAAEIVLFLYFFRKESIKSYLLSAALFGLLVSPWLGILVSRTETINNGGSWLQEASLSELYGLINKFLNDKWSTVALLSCIIVLVVLRGRSFFEMLLREKKKMSVLLMISFVPYLLSFLLSKTIGLNLFYDRYLYFITLPLFISLIFIFDQFEIKEKSLFVIFIWVFILRFNPTPLTDRNGDELAKYVRSLNEKTIFIAPGYYDLTFLYHFDRKLFSDYRSVEKNDLKNIHSLEKGEPLTKIIEENQSVILVDADINFTQPRNTIYRDLKSRMNKISSKKFKGNYEVSLWRKSINVE